MSSGLSKVVRQKEFFRAENAALRNEVKDLKREIERIRSLVPERLPNSPSTRSFPFPASASSPSVSSEDVKEEPKPWEIDLQKFVEKRGEEKLHPADATAVQVRRWLEDFMKIFRNTPDDGKRWLLQQPLVPNEIKSSTAGPEHSLALHLVFYLSDFTTLQEISPYLTKEDCQKRCPFSSTFLHMIVSGIEKGVKGSPCECAEFLIQKDPDLPNQTNFFGYQAYRYAKYVLYRLDPGEVWGEMVLQKLIDLTTIEP